MSCPDPYTKNAADSPYHSDLRDIPDHQEVFLSRETLTSITFEINEFQTTSQVVGAPTDAEPATATSPDISAAEHHFKDLIDAEDKLSGQGLRTVAVKLAQQSLAKYPAYVTGGTILVHEIDKKAKSVLPREWQSDPLKKVSETRTIQLLVRMADHETDLCVRVDVPLKEYKDDAGKAKSENAAAEAIMEHVVASLDVKDFGLFGGGE